MANVIDLDNLTLKDIEKLKNVLGITEQQKKEKEEDAYRRRADEVGTRPGYMKVTQINCQGNKYFCITDEEEAIFTLNHPEVKTETFHIELPIAVANKYLNAPGNKEAFQERKE